MKILHLMNTFSESSETFIYDLILNLEKEEDLDNYVFAYTRKLENERPYSKVKIANKLLGRLAYKFNLHKKFDLYAPLPFVRSYKPDVIHIHFGWSAWQYYSQINKYFPQIPVVVSFHGTDVNAWPHIYKGYKEFLAEISNKDNIVFTAHSNNLKNKLLNLGVNEKSLRILNNSFKNKFNDNRKQNFFKHGEQLKIINIGRLISVKGQQYLIEGFAKFNKNIYENSQLNILGDGELKEELLNLAKEVEIVDKVNFMGAVSHNDLPDFLKNQDIYIHSSIKDDKTMQEEGIPIAILEAIASGLPVIVTNTGGMPEQIAYENKHSKIVPDKNSDAIYQAIKDMFENPETFTDNSEYAQDRLKEFSVEKQISTLKDIYNSFV